MSRSIAPWVPAAMIVASTFMNTLEAVFLRMLGSEASQAQVLLFRSGMQLLMVAVFSTVYLRRGISILRTQRLPHHLLRGSLAAISWWCYYMSFKTLPLALATTLSFSTQLFVLLLVWPMLRERVTRVQLVTTLVGFCGVLIAAGLWSPSTLDWRVSYGLASAMIGAVMLLITRSLSFTERTETILFYMALMVFLSAIPQCLFDWVPLTAHSLTLLGLMSFIGTLGAWLLVAAYARAQPSELAPYTYVRLLFAAALGYWLFGDVVAGTTVAGALLIVASNLASMMFMARSAKAAGR